MKAVNLYLLTRMREQDFYTQYENVLSGREEVMRVRGHEFENLIHLVDLLCSRGITVEELDGFHYAYTIRQIGKEFDLLKIDPNRAVLNIELKSQQVSEEKIQRQLVKNKYYLGSAAPKLYLFTYVEETGIFYKLEGEQLSICSEMEVMEVLRDFQTFTEEDIDALFSAKDYLISPLNMPEKFMENRYFLTQQQEAMKNELSAALGRDGEPLYWGITGRDGTGKTLLLYDLAKTFARQGRCCIVHCGALSAGHLQLHERMGNVDIIEETAVSETLLRTYAYLFIDETQRISTEVLDIIVKTAAENRIFCVFSYDYFQTLSKTEQRRNIPGMLNALDDFQERRLSGKIRSNEEMSSFICTLLDLGNRAGKPYRYDAVDILFAQTPKEAETVIGYYCREKDYTCITYDACSDAGDGLRRYRAEEVIGQEFERVIITLDERFRYNEAGKLQGKNHPNPDYIYDRIFFQGVSRTREKLCIVIVGNMELFAHIIDIKFRTMKDPD